MLKTLDINISLDSNKKAYIENYHSIIDYNDKIIKLKGRQFSIKLSGSKLFISSYTKTDMYIEGKIKNIEYYNEIPDKGDS